MGSGRCSKVKTIKRFPASTGHGPFIIFLLTRHTFDQSPCTSRNRKHTPPIFSSNAKNFTSLRHDVITSITDDSTRPQSSLISTVARENILYFSSDRILSTTVFVSHAIEGTLHRSSAQTPRISQVKHLRHDVITSITDDTARSTRHRKARIIVGWESRDDLYAARFTFYTQEMNRNLHLPSLRALLFAHFREAVPLACAALLPCFREAVPLARALFIADSLAAAAFCRFAAFFLGCLRAFAVCFAASAAAAARTDPLPLACAQTLQGAHAASACCGVPCCAPSPAGPVPQRCKSSGSQHRRWE